MATDEAPDEVRASRAVAVGTDVGALLLGDSYRPGGLGLTRRLAGQLGLAAGEHVLDVASGRGASAIVLAHEYRVRVDGIDRSPSNVALATGAADAANLGSRVTFAAGDAERLPFADDVFDALVCECAFRTFRNKTVPAGELARVLRPGGRVGITDVTADPVRLRGELTTLAAWVACVADARPADAYAALLAGAGLRVTHSGPHDVAMIRMIDQIEARLTVVDLTVRARAEALGLDFDRADSVLAAARSAVADGVLGYTLIVAEKPA